MVNLLSAGMTDAKDLNSRQAADGRKKGDVRAETPKQRSPNLIHQPLTEEAVS
jgi:hypothetical protein